MIDAKNDGRDIPKTETNRINLSIKVSLYNAENTPKIKPRNKAIPIDEIAKTKVFLKVFPSIEVTGVHLRTNDSLRYGTLKTRV